MREINGIKIFNATPHPVTFWEEGWPEPITVPPDEVINARPVEREVGRVGEAVLVRTEFVPDEAGWEVIRWAEEAGADLIVGSIIAAQAYPGKVVAMTPAPGFERVPPERKRMSPSKFTVF